jgi:hypothetical protein
MACPICGTPTGLTNRGSFCAKHTPFKGSGSLPRGLLIGVLGIGVAVVVAGQMESRAPAPDIDREESLRRTRAEMVSPHDLASDPESLRWIIGRAPAESITWHTNATPGPVLADDQRVFYGAGAVGTRFHVWTGTIAEDSPGRLPSDHGVAAKAEAIVGQLHALGDSGFRLPVPRGESFVLALTASSRTGTEYVAVHRVPDDEWLVTSSKRPGWQKLLADQAGYLLLAVTKHRTIRVTVKPSQPQSDDLFYLFEIVQGRH